MVERQDAIALLKADHRAVEDLFEKFESARGDGAKQKIARQICLELTVHAQIEEEIFYPACEGKVEEDLIREAYVEHDGAKVLIAEIIAGGPLGRHVQPGPPCRAGHGRTGRPVARAEGRTGRAIRGRGLEQARDHDLHRGGHLSGAAIRPLCRICLSN